MSLQRRKRPFFASQGRGFSLATIMQKVFNLLGALGFVMSGTMAVMGVVAYTRVPSMVKNYRQKSEARADEDDS